MKISVKGTPAVKSKNNLAMLLEINKAKLAKSAEVIKVLQSNTPVDTGRARAGWTYEDSTIINNVEYIDGLNRGSSRQAPAFFIERSVLSVPGVKANGTIVDYN